MCGTTGESLSHLLIYCPMAAALWRFFAHEIQGQLGDPRVHEIFVKQLV